MNAILYLKEYIVFDTPNISFDTQANKILWTTIFQLLIQVHIETECDFRFHDGDEVSEEEEDDASDAEDVLPHVANSSWHDYIILS